MSVRCPASSTWEFTQYIRIAGDPFELAPDALEVLRAHAHVEHLLDHRKYVSERIVPNGGMHQADRRRQHECVSITFAETPRW
jgi:hypothetical protein